MVRAGISQDCLSCWFSFQLHVLGYTVHSVLDNMSSQCKPGALDDCMDELVMIFIDDIFGTVGEEKDVEAITNKLKEAKTTKSFLSFQIAARVVSPESFPKIMDPLKDAMATSESIRVAQKLEDIFRNIANGLGHNESIDMPEMLKLIYSLLTENLDAARRGSLVKKTQSIRPSSIHLIQKQSGREKTPAMCYNTNAHLLSEMGLLLLSNCLKRHKLDPKSQEHLEMLDPFTPHLVEAIHSKYVLLRPGGWGLGVLL